MPARPLGRCQDRCSVDHHDRRVAAEQVIESGFRVQGRARFDSILRKPQDVRCNIPKTSEATPNNIQDALEANQDENTREPTSLQCWSSNCGTTTPAAIRSADNKKRIPAAILFANLRESRPASQPQLRHQRPRHQRPRALLILDPARNMLIGLNFRRLGDVSGDIGYSLGRIIQMIGWHTF